MPNSRYDPSDSRYWEEPESNEELDPSYYFANDPYDDEDDPDYDDAALCPTCTGKGSVADEFTLSVVECPICDGTG